MTEAAHYLMLRLEAEIAARQALEDRCQHLQNSLDAALASIIQQPQVQPDDRVLGAVAPHALEQQERGAQVLGGPPDGGIEAAWHDIVAHEQARIRSMDAMTALRYREPRLIRDMP